MTARLVLSSYSSLCPYLPFFRQGYHPLPLGSPKLGVLLIPALLIPGITPTFQLGFIPLQQAYQNKMQILKAGYLLTYFYFSFP